MATLVFLAHEQSRDAAEWRQEAQQLMMAQLDTLASPSRNWTVFRVARLATRLVSASQLKQHTQSNQTLRECVYNVTSVVQRLSPWSSYPVKVEMKFHLECKLRLLLCTIYNSNRTEWSPMSACNHTSDYEIAGVRFVDPFTPKFKRYILQTF